jgi:hypothetical protein
MIDIPFEVEGIVLNSLEVEGIPEMTILVHDDPDQTGGYFIFKWWEGSNGPNEHHAFDAWVESFEALQQFFVEAGWKVQWGTGATAR